MSKILSQNLHFPQKKNNMVVFSENILVFSLHVCFCKYVKKKPNLCVKLHFGRCLTFTQHVWKKPNTLVYLHLGAFFHTCLDFNTYVREKAHMCEKSHTIIYLQMLGIFHTCVGKATDMLISP